jgi:Flp pilus assembly pilin Flp
MWRPQSEADLADMAFQSWVNRIGFRWNREEGQTMSEYAVILGVITPAIVLAYALLSGDIGGLIDKVRAIFGG